MQYLPLISESMPPIEDQIQALIDQPSEKLNVELKPWIDPVSPWANFL